MVTFVECHAARLFIQTHPWIVAFQFVPYRMFYFIYILPGDNKTEDIEVWVLTKQEILAHTKG